MQLQSHIAAVATLFFLLLAWIDNNYQVTIMLLWAHTYQDNDWGAKWQSYNHCGANKTCTHAYFYS